MKSEDALLQVLKNLNVELSSEVLSKTPGRFVKALGEMTQGYKTDPKEVLGTVFEETGCDEMIILRDIPFTSICEHHLLSFTGTVDIGYLPSKCRVTGIDPASDHTEMGTHTIETYRIVGLSKLARLVDCFSQRLQVQERMTRQIAEAVMSEPLSAQGVGVVVRGEHSCVSCRGIKKSGSVMVTSSMLGLFRDEQEVRNEFLSLCREK